jgi:hypothetical protein
MGHDAGAPPEKSTARLADGGRRGLSDPRPQVPHTGLANRVSFLTFFAIQILINAWQTKANQMPHQLKVADTFAELVDTLSMDERSYTGALLSHIRWPVHISGEGMHCEFRYRDYKLDPPDNDFNVSILLVESILAALANGSINGSAHAHTIIRENKSRIVTAVKRWIEKQGSLPSSARPGVLLPNDIH